MNIASRRPFAGRASAASRSASAAICSPVMMTGSQRSSEGGAAAPLIREAAAKFGVAYPVVDATDMHDAVRRATEMCSAGDAVVLSPACASYDMFQNYGHRGRVFREAVSAVGAKRLDV